MAAPLDKVPGKAWVVVFAGTAVNLFLGILYAWSVWAKALINEKLVGQPLPDALNAGWNYLNNAQAATPFSLCVIIFAILMIPGGRIQDKYGPKVGATTGGLFLALGCIIAGLMKSYTGLVIGFMIGPVPAGFTGGLSTTSWRRPATTRPDSSSRSAPPSFVASTTTGACSNRTRRRYGPTSTGGPPRTAMSRC
jgi:MFS family permease